MADISKDARLVARVSPEIQDFVKHAAALSGATLTQFLVNAVTEKAREVIDRENTIQLTMQGAKTVFDALDNPPPMNDRLQKAVKRYKEGGFQYAGSTAT